MIFLVRYDNKQIRSVDYILTEKYIEKLAKPNLSRIL